MSTWKELTERCSLCYCNEVDVDIEEGRIKCKSSECGCVYMMNKKETEGIRIFLKIGLIEDRFEILDL